VQDVDKLVKDLTQMLGVLASLITTVFAYLTIKIKPGHSREHQQEQIHDQSEYTPE
jgi:hypothetical protein